MLNSSVLVLNRSYLPIQVTTVRRAVVLLYQGIAEAVDQDWRTYDFGSWREVSERIPPSQRNGTGIHLVHGFLQAPRVLLLRRYNRAPKMLVRFCRVNIFLRDSNVCQYCGKTFAKPNLNLDHVTPRSRGGRTCWENIVCSCLDCNRRKGGNTPTEAGMRLLRQPEKPSWDRLFAQSLGRSYHREWNPFLKEVDRAYWNARLEED